MGQQALFFLQRLTPNSSAYNVAAGVRIHEPVDLAALQRSVRQVADRHELLRSYYEEDATGSGRLLCPEPAAVEVRDVPERADHALAALVEQLVAEPFQLDRRPPFRVVLLRAGAGENVLLTLIHHIATDLSSQVTVLRELLRCYADVLGRRSFTPPPPGPGFAQHVAQEAEFLRSPQRAAAVEYWQQVCRGAGGIAFLTDPATGAAPVGGQLTFTLDDSLTRAVEQAAARHGVTIFHWLLAAFQLAIVRVGGGSDFLLGYPSTLRRHARQRHAVGYYVNVLPLRVSLASSAGLPEVAVRTASQVGDARLHLRYPTAMMPCVLGPSRPSGRPPVQAAFNMITAYPRNALWESLVTGERVDFAGVPLSGLDISQQVGQTPLAMDACHLPGRIVVRIKFRTEMVSAATAEALRDSFRALLERTS